MKTYYEKVLISSGELPEKDGWYQTDDGIAPFTLSGEWRKTLISSGSPVFWFKPYSPKEEAAEFAEWLADNYDRCHGGFWLKYSK